MTYYSESASKLFTRTSKAQSFLPLEEKLFPGFTSNDIVEIYGKSGSGKTELLYHLIICCIFPASWKGLCLGGLEMQVLFIDNDCHFNLFRLVAIIENRIKVCINSSAASIQKEEIFSFIQDTLKLLYIVHCYDVDEYILTLNSFDSMLCMQNKRSIIMIDGISSFYWSEKSRFQGNFSKLMAHYKGITELIIKISKDCGTPVIVTRRKLLCIADNDEKVFGKIWKNVVQQLKLEFKASLPDKTEITVLHSGNSSLKLCSITKSGFTIFEK